MRREPENGDVQVAGTSLLSLMFGRLWWAGGELAPTGETPRVPLGFVLLDSLLEIPA
jgi:hypothetical protein